MLDFKKFYSKAHSQSINTKRIVGSILILLGLFAFFTPLTPGSWLIFFGLELLGLRLAVWDRIKSTLFK